jgi:hypothetical protein
MEPTTEFFQSVMTDPERPYEDAAFWEGVDNDIDWDEWDFD